MAIVLGVFSILWDGGMGNIFPFIALFSFAVYWRKNLLVLPAILLYLHHVFSLNTGIMEILILAFLYLFTELEKVFLNPAVSYFSFSGIVLVSIYFSYGLTALLTSLPFAFLFYLWREKG